jgi:hypothetical protein
MMEPRRPGFPQMLTRYGASARSARARRTYDRIILFQHPAEFAADVEAFLSDPGQGGSAQTS